MLSMQFLVGQAREKCKAISTVEHWYMYIFSYYSRGQLWKQQWLIFLILFGKKEVIKTLSKAPSSVILDMFIAARTSFLHQRRGLQIHTPKEMLLYVYFRNNDHEKWNLFSKLSKKRGILFFNIVIVIAVFCRGSHIIFKNSEYFSVTVCWLQPTGYHSSDWPLTWILIHLCRCPTISNADLW